MTNNYNPTYLWQVDPLLVEERIPSNLDQYNYFRLPRPVYGEPSSEYALHSRETSSDIGQCNDVVHEFARLADFPLLVTELRCL
jgi:hypothetical protein